MRNKNMWVMIVALLLIGLIFLLALFLPRRTASLPDSLAPLLSQSPESSTSQVSPAEDTLTESSLPPATPVPARGYVCVTVGTSSRWFALPEAEDLSFTISQTQGEEKQENVIHLTQDGVYMESSTCENQDCVHQGAVTLENKDTRLLANMIICLPHQVSIELYTPDELLAQAGQ